MRMGIEYLLDYFKAALHLFCVHPVDIKDLCDLLPGYI